MAAGKVAIKIGIEKAKNFSSQTDKIRREFFFIWKDLKSSLSVGKLSSLLFQGMNDAIEEYKVKARQAANLTELGFNSSVMENLQDMADKFEQIGYNAEQATDIFTQFLATGKATTLQGIGIYLDSNTKSILTNASAQERLNWIMKNGNHLLKSQSDAMPENIKAMIQMKKASDDVKKALGSSFSNTLTSIINLFGGVNNAMKMAIVAFTAYKMAMIVGNVMIGISKAIAVGTVFSAPVAIGMGAAALAALGVMGAMAGIAYNSIGSESSTAQTSNSPTVTNVIQLEVTEDRFGKEIIEKNGNNNGRV
ncbi:hypothetical protein [Mesomycoplasma lagogenitalium]|uniref:Tape measure protein n=1 Tax=Mesomycoplasma lagogenitalium TaxID=171286 RepID=A0ABY8LUT3_9BACT|nr:hypothetical protein [Mesomycoplasma lagogenitalium]WGI36480.1 hypothetical protein QEG99_03375 [Mesomycoplasma lagogenitalium]